MKEDICFICHEPIRAEWFAHPGGEIVCPRCERGALLPGLHCAARNRATDGRPYVRGWFTPARIAAFGDAAIWVCIAAVLYMAATQFAVGCGLLP